MIETEEAEILPDLPPEIIKIILVYTERVDVAMELDHLHIIKKMVPKTYGKANGDEVS